MKEKARQTLEYVIKKLDEKTRPSEKGSWKSQTEKETKPSDEETLRLTYFSLNVIMNAQQARDDGMGKVLVGENILTPALVNKGWQFWKQLLLTEKEKKAVESAVIRWSEAKVAQLNSLRDTIGKSPNKDDISSGILFLASVLDIGSSCRRQLSADLKMILADAKGD